MVIGAAGASIFQSVMQLIGIVVVFIIILAVTYYTTKWIGASGMAGGRGRNIKVIESYRLGQNSFLQIVKAGESYLLLGVTKERIELLSKLDPEEVHMEEPLSRGSETGFKEILANIREKRGKKE